MSRSASSRRRRPSKRASSASNTRSHGSSWGPRKSRCARSSSTLTGRSISRNKISRPPFGPPDFARLTDDQLVQDGPLAGAGAQQPPDPLGMFAGAEPAADHDPDLGVRDVQPLVQDLG